MKDQIYFYDKRFSGKNRPVRKMDFEIAFKAWVNYNGGTSQFLKDIKTLDFMDLVEIQYRFIEFFHLKYPAVLPAFEDEYFQEHIWNADFYIMYINRLTQEHQDRPFALGNILFLAVIVLAILGLVSLCS